MTTKESSSEADISGIDPERLSEIIYAKWRKERKGLRQIARELNLPIQKVQHILSRKQKSLIQIPIQKGSLKR